MNSEATSTLVIFGATGDLSSRKIIPSLWHLFKHNRIPKTFSVVGFARQDLSNTSFQDYIWKSIESHSEEKVDEKMFEAFCNLFSYHRGSFEDVEAFQSLADRLRELEGGAEATQRLLYLAAPPTTYQHIFTNLAAAGLNDVGEGELPVHRVLIEKPFGSNMASARALQELLLEHFKEEQIYRIDHYLFKEIVQGIENFRFSNNLFENTWDNTTIERIDIRLHESIGIKGRGSFYDSVGALRDVGQNHLLMMLAAITMEYPMDAGAEAIQKSRAKILESLTPWTDERIQKDTFRAQFEGYLEVEGVTSDSHTETYFGLKTGLEHPKWSGIPIFLEAGKGMKEACKEIVLTLKHPDVCLLCDVEEHRQNRITFRLEPNDEITIHFWTKKPGFERILEERTLSFFLYEKESKVQYVEEYSKILLTALEGTRSLFVSPEEVEALWSFTDPVVDAWQRNIVPLETYTLGESVAPALLKAKHGIHGKANKVEKESESVFRIGYVGLGKMGMNMAERLLEYGHEVTAFDRDESAREKIQRQGAQIVTSLSDLPQQLEGPRTLWLMVPHTAVDSVLSELVPHLREGDVVIDGGNSPYKESVRRAKELKEKGIDFIDVGVSGGPHGARHGACLMVGGQRELFHRYERLFADLSVDRGYGYMGSSGAGHFVKMVHNGIEYGMMQAIGEGFEIMKKAPFSLDLKHIAGVYNHGSVITSSLIGWLADAYAQFGEDLDTEECCSGSVDASGEGTWTVETAKELGVPVSIIEGALTFREESQDSPSYTGQVLSALRHEFGGHDAGRVEKEE